MQESCKADDWDGGWQVKITCEIICTILNIGLHLVNIAKSLNIMIYLYLRIIYFMIKAINTKLIYH